MKTDRKVCGAKLRGKNKTCQKSPMTNGRCRLHGGLTPSGPDSANYKHGKYADAFKGQMRARFLRAQSDAQPLDMIADLNVQRALLEEYLSQLTNRKKVKLNELINASGLAQDVVKSAATITQTRQKTALTIAEVRFIKQGMLLLLERYVPNPDDRRNFIADLSALIPDRDDAASAEPAELSAGTGAAV